MDTFYPLHRDLSTRFIKPQQGRTKTHSLLVTEPAQPTELCAHQWGYFGSGDSAQCGYFYNCVNGFPFRVDCPIGLAFSSATYRCEWPDESPDCDADGKSHKEACVVCYVCCVGTEGAGWLVARLGSTSLLLGLDSQFGRLWIQ